MSVKRRIALFSPDKICEGFGCTFQSNFQRCGMLGFGCVSFYTNPGKLEGFSSYALVDYIITYIHICSDVHNRTEKCPELSFTSATRRSQQPKAKNLMCQIVNMCFVSSIQHIQLFMPYYYEQKQLSCQREHILICL